MENSTFVLFSSVAALICVAYVEFKVHQAYRQSRVVLLGKIDNAEKELRQDILQLGEAELIKTKSGKELLRLLGNNNEVITARYKDQKVAVPKVSLRLQTSAASSAFRWVFIGFLGIIMMSLLLGTNFKDATWLNSDIAAAEANLINIENAHQQATYELQERLVTAQTEAEIQQVLREQQLLDAQYQHHIQVLAQDLARRDLAFRTGMSVLVILAGAFALTIFVSTTVWVGSNALAKLRLVSTEELIKRYEEQIQTLSQELASSNTSSTENK